MSLILQDRILHSLASLLRTKLDGVFGSRSCSFLSLSLTPRIGSIRSRPSSRALLFSKLTVPQFATRTSLSKPCKHLLYIGSCKFKQKLVVLVSASSSKVAVSTPNKPFVGNCHFLVKHAIGFVTAAKVHFGAKLVKLLQATKLKVAGTLDKVSAVDVHTKLKTTTVYEPFLEHFVQRHLVIRMRSNRKVWFVLLALKESAKAQRSCCAEKA